MNTPISDAGVLAQLDDPELAWALMDNPPKTPEDLTAVAPSLSPAKRAMVLKLYNLTKCSWADSEWLESKALDNKPKEILWLLRDVLPQGRVGILAGGGGAGKSWALCQLALSIATQKPWLGTYAISHPGRVLLALAEEDMDEIH